jgi:hypothetical protein
MIDWRVTPNLDASLSKDSIIQIGKSTLTLRCDWLGRLILERSKDAEMSFSLSNSESNFLAFIYFDLFNSGSSHGDDSYALISMGDYGGPVFIKNLPNHEIARLIDSLGRNLQEIGSSQNDCASAKSMACFLRFDWLFCESNSNNMGIINIP